MGDVYFYLTFILYEFSSILKMGTFTHSPTKPFLRYLLLCKVISELLNFTTNSLSICSLRSGTKNYRIDFVFSTILIPIFISPFRSNSSRTFTELLVRSMKSEIRDHSVSSLKNK